MSSLRRPGGRAGTPVRRGVSALAYKNRRGATYYLHEGTTKTGNRRYFVAKAERDGALPAMPEGFEFVESINGVVSVRRIDTTPRLVPEIDAVLVRKTIEGHKHLARCRVELRKSEIVVHEPLSGEVPRGLSLGHQDMDVARLARVLGIDEHQLRSLPRQADAFPVQYRPVMKFVLADFGLVKNYRAFRMTYRGKGGWAELSAGPLAKLAAKYIGHIGRESFFDLW
jgi:hypothetical protein